MQHPNWNQRERNSEKHTSSQQRSTAKAKVNVAAGQYSCTVPAPSKYSSRVTSKKNDGWIGFDP